MTDTADDEIAVSDDGEGGPGRSRRRDHRGAGEHAAPFGEGFGGVIPNLRRRYEEGSWVVQGDLEPYRTLRECATCGGFRLRPQSLAVQVKGRTLADYVNLPISEALDQFRATVREQLPTDGRRLAVPVFARRSADLTTPVAAFLALREAPVGFDDRGLPMGMQLIGRPRADVDLLRVAHSYESTSNR